MIFSKSYQEPPFCEREILRYAGCKKADVSILALLHECINEGKEKITYRVCYRELPVTTDGDVCDFEAFRVQSGKLAANLSGCEKVIIFGATIGLEIDRLIAKYSRLSPSKALMFQAIGAERIEALCDAFCDDIAKEYQAGQRPRFSPGYGDLALEVQQGIFAVLDCERKIGLTLNNSLLMTPSKSVTAFVGIGGKENKMINKCSACDLKDCAFRGAL